MTLLASQPWPIGRAGSCELMLACKVGMWRDVAGAVPTVSAVSTIIFDTFIKE